ncbi:MAG TPA: hypothetical protein VGV93_02685 [Acidimicrobiales bacterium]|nr:hypothetical protein [Acidimicrobiales bacterium]
MAAVAVVGQSLARQVQLEAVEHPALGGLGMSRGQLGAVLVVQALVVGLVGAALAFAASLDRLVGTPALQGWGGTSWWATATLTTSTRAVSFCPPARSSTASPP